MRGRLLVTGSVWATSVVGDAIAALTILSQASAIPEYRKALLQTFDPSRARKALKTMVVFALATWVPLVAVAPMLPCLSTTIPLQDILQMVAVYLD